MSLLVIYKQKWTGEKKVYQVLQLDRCLSEEEFKTVKETVELRYGMVVSMEKTLGGNDMMDLILKKIKEIP